LEGLVELFKYFKNPYLIIALFQATIVYFLYDSIARISVFGIYRAEDSKLIIKFIFLFSFLPAVNLFLKNTNLKKRFIFLSFLAVIIYYIQESITYHSKGDYGVSIMIVILWNFIICLILLPFGKIFTESGELRFDYKKLYEYAWENFFLIFYCCLFLIAYLVICWLTAALFKSVGINHVKELIESSYFIIYSCCLVFSFSFLFLFNNKNFIHFAAKILLDLLRFFLPIISAIIILYCPFQIATLGDVGKDNINNLLIYIFAAIVCFNCYFRDGINYTKFNNKIHNLVFLSTLAQLFLSVILITVIFSKITNTSLTTTLYWQCFFAIILFFYCLGYTIAFIRSFDPKPFYLTNKISAFILVLFLIFTASDISGYKKLPWWSYYPTNNLAQERADKLPQVNDLYIDKNIKSIESPSDLRKIAKIYPKNLEISDAFLNLVISKGYTDYCVFKDSKCTLYFSDLNKDGELDFIIQIRESRYNITVYIKTHNSFKKTHSNVIGKETSTKMDFSGLIEKNNTELEEIKSYRLKISDDEYIYINDH
jgi:hypothetical protein